MTANDISEPESEFWLFGYGSLIWKPPPHFDEYRAMLLGMCEDSGRYAVALIRYAGIKLIQDPGQDHRGTPEAPGRVVTLIERSFWETLVDPHPSGSDKVWGTAYRIEAAKVAEVREYLDIREINGYTIHYTEFHPADDSATIKTLVYIGTPDNDQFMGPQNPQNLAEHIYKSEGPSGLNKDYLLGLETALDNLSKESGDEHIKDLANRVRRIEQDAHVEPGCSFSEPFKKLREVDSTDEQEETEK